MSRDGPEIAFAKEVYAACATIGFTSAAVTRLKRVLDENGEAAEMLALAQQAQRESIAWAGSSERAR